MFAAESRGELTKGTARRWAHHTKNISALPERKHKKKAEDNAFARGLLELSSIKAAAGEGPPNYRPAQPLGPSCGTCKYFQAANSNCTKYATQVEANYLCDGFASKQNIDAGAIMDAGNPPKLALPEAPMAPEGAFKAGFFLRCAEEQLTTEETEKRAAAVVELTKNATDPTTWSRLLGLFKAPGQAIIGPAFNKYLETGMAGLVGIPAGLGLGAGYIGGKIHNRLDTDDVEALKREGLLAEYRRLAEDAKYQAAVKKM